jgi:hypothetical protein
MVLPINRGENRFARQARVRIGRSIMKRRSGGAGSDLCRNGVRRACCLHRSLLSGRCYNSDFAGW